VPKCRKSALSKFPVGQQVRINKYKDKFAKGVEHNYTNYIFTIPKVVRSNQRPVYELEDSQGREREVYFYAKEMNPVLISKRTTYKMENILKNRSGYTPGL